MSKAVLVIGDLILDKYTEGHVSRVSPEAPVPVVRIEKESYRIGGSGNVAHNIAKQEVPVLLAGAIAADQHGVILKGLLQQSGIGVHLLETLPVTTTKVRIIGNHQQIVRIDYENTEDALAVDTDLPEQLLAKEQYAVCVVSDYNKGFCGPAVCRRIIESAPRKGTRVIVDPKHYDWEVYRGAYMVTPNFKEFCQALNRNIPNQDEAIAEAARELKQKFSIGNLLVTRSEKGMTLVSETGVLHLPAYTVDVYDVSGAGDTVVGVIAASLAEGMNIETAVQRANIAASIVVSKFGTYALSKKELEQRMADINK